MTDACEACGIEAEEEELIFDEDSEVFVCDECWENPPDDR